MKKLVLLMAVLSISACATTTPLPDVKGSVVRPLNPTKWDYQAAVLEKQKEIEYSIQSISGKDLNITKENDKVVVSFEYDKEIELADPVYLLIKYKGRSK